MRTNKQAKKAKLVIKAETVTPAVAESVIETPVTETAPAKPNFAKHDIITSYAGASKPFTTRKSRTPINAAFNSLPDAILTDRDEAFLAGLKKQYAGEQFPRLNADAGNLRRAIERGFIQYGTESNTFQLTEKALTQRFAA